jgi:hypothetical protein
VGLLCAGFVDQPGTGSSELCAISGLNYVAANDSASSRTAVDGVRLSPTHKPDFTKCRAIRGYSYKRIVSQDAS